MKKLLIILIFIALTVTSACTKSEGLTKSDTVFDINSKSIELDSDVAVLLDELGDEYAFSEAPSCVYDGTDKYYSYTDVEVYTYPLDGKDLIDEIVLLTPKYSTRRGVKVGDLFRVLKLAYGDDYKMDGNVVTYSLDPEDPQSPTIYFTVDNDTVTSIHFYSASNLIS